MIVGAALQISADVSLLSFDSVTALIALTAMEIVLGIDNIVFIAIVTGRLPKERRSMARRVGLILAMVMRILLLMMIGWLMGLTEPLIELSRWVPVTSIAEDLAANPEINEVSARDLILMFGGLFLLYTAVREIHHKIEGLDDEDGDEESELSAQPANGSASGNNKLSVGGVLFRIAFMDVIFSLDSVITAVGMADRIEIMILAIVISIGVMIAFANQISDFVQNHPTVKMLALSFLILIGVVLVSESAGTPISKGYVYFAMAFSLMVEFFNLRMSAKKHRRDDGDGHASVSTP